MIAVVWHWWIAPVMAFAVFGLLVATVAGYFFKVVKPRYPNKAQRKAIAAQAAAELTP